MYCKTQQYGELMADIQCYFKLLDTMSLCYGGLFDHLLFAAF